MLKSKIKHLIPLVAGLLIGSAGLQAQQIGSAGATNPTLDTSPFGGQLAHEENPGTFGTFGPGERWIGIGNPKLATGPLPVYGIRIQDNGNAATWSLKNTAGTYDLEESFGDNVDSKYRLQFITSLALGTQRTILTANSQGNVGIDQDNPQARLEVNVDAGEVVSAGLRVENQNASGTGALAIGDLIGSYGQVSPGTGGSPTKVAIAGATTNASSTDNYGVSGFALGATGFCVGVYGSINTSTAADPYAGYFNGDVFTTGAYLPTPSDARIKNNVENLGSVMDGLMKMRATTYEYKQDGKFENVNFSKGYQRGFIAQEVEEIFPDLVKEHGILLEENVFDIDENGTPIAIENPETMRIKTVNYMGMIPILTKGLQEQQVVIEAKNAEIADLNDRVSDLEGRLAALEGRATSKGNAGSAIDATNVLYQNSPNPFDRATSIRYSIAEGAQSAEIIVFDMNGRQLRVFNELKAGENALTVDGAELEAGMYFYSLIVNGEEVATKRMILTK